MLLFKYFLSCVIAFSGAVVYASEAPASIPTKTESNGVQPLLQVREHLAKAHRELETQGYLSNTTKVALTVSLAGAASFGVAAAVPILGSAGAYLAGGGVAVGSSGSVAGSLIQQTKELVGQSTRANINAQSQQLVQIIEQTLALPDLTIDQYRQLEKLRAQFQRQANNTTHNPWYIKTLNVVEGALTVVGILIVLCALIPGGESGILIGAFLLVPVSLAGNITRAVDEYQTVGVQKEEIRRAIEAIDVELSQGGGAFNIPLP